MAKHSPLTAWLTVCDSYAHAPTSWNTFHVMNSRNAQLYFALRESGYTQHDLYRLYLARCRQSHERKQ